MVKIQCMGKKKLRKEIEIFFSSLVQVLINNNILKQCQINNQLNFQLVHERESNSRASASLAIPSFSTTT